MSYASDLYDRAILQGWTPQQAMDATYQQIATVCNVALGPNGESPADFFYHHIRSEVAKRLRQEIDAAEAEAQRVHIRDKIKELLEFANATIEPYEEGAWIIRRNP